MLEPTFRDGLVFYGQSGIHLNFFNISQKEYLSIHEKLVLNFDLNISKIRFFQGEYTINRRGEKEPRHVDILSSLIRFEIRCIELLSIDFDIQPLIQDFNLAQRDYGIDESNHIFSLTKLCLAYYGNGFNVTLIPSTKYPSPDLKINNIRAELKTRKEADFRDFMLRKLELDEFETGKIYGLKYSLSDALTIDLGQSIKNRFKEASLQADLVFFDFSLLPSLDKYQLSLSKRGYVTSIPEPKKFRLILFSAKEMNSTDQNYIQPPYLWTFIDFDPLLWKLIASRPIVQVFTKT